MRAIPTIVGESESEMGDRFIEMKSVLFSEDCNISLQFLSLSQIIIVPSASTMRGLRVPFLEYLSLGICLTQIEIVHNIFFAS